MFAKKETIGAKQAIAGLMLGADKLKVNCGCATMSRPCHPQP
jgi:hypothetical protein